MPDSLYTLLGKLECEHALSRGEWEHLISCRTPDLAKDMKSRACALRDERCGKRVFKRGLINSLITVRMIALLRYSAEAISLRIGTAFPKKEILQCCKQGFELGFRTFVLQGGEDPYYTDARMVSIVSSIREAYPECAITLSVGSAPRSRIAHFVLQELIDICCATKLQTPSLWSAASE